MGNKVAVVTGSYSGIGRELSRMLVAKGFDLVMINRNKAKGNEFVESLLREYPNCSVDSYVLETKQGVVLAQPLVARRYILQSIDLRQFGL